MLINGTEHAIVLGAPVLADLVIQNRGAGPLQVDLGHNRKSKLEITVTPPGGHEIVTPRSSEEGFGRAGKIVLQAGEEYRQTLILNEWYEFAQPGRYGVKVRLVDATADDGVAAVDVDILPRDPDALASVCRALAARAMNPSNAADALEASRALTYVHDPVAVPWLKQVLEGGRPEAKIEVASALGELATPDAVAALIHEVDASRSNVDVRRVVERSLRVARTKTNDADVRRRIDDALGGVPR